MIRPVAQYLQIDAANTVNRRGEVILARGQLSHGCKEAGRAGYQRVRLVEEVEAKRFDPLVTDVDTDSARRPVPS